MNEIAQQRPLASEEMTGAGHVERKAIRPAWRGPGRIAPAPGCEPFQVLRFVKRRGLFGLKRREDRAGIRQQHARRKPSRLGGLIDRGHSPAALAAFDDRQRLARLVFKRPGKRLGPFAPLRPPIRKPYRNNPPHDNRSPME